MTAPRRTVAVIARELADVERFLTDAPPHSDGGVRDRLAQRRAALQRELATARTAPTGRAGPERAG